LLRVNEVAELQRIADEKDRSVVAGHVPVALFSVELKSESARITLGISRTLFAAHCGEAQKRRSLLADGAEQLCCRVFRDLGTRADEVAVSAGTLCVNNSLGNALAIEMRHFFEEQEVFENPRATRAYRE